MPDQIAALLFMLLLISFVLSLVPVLKTQHKFLQLYKDIAHPSFPITTEDLQEFINKGRVNPMFSFQMTKVRLKLIWQQHDDKRLNQMAKKIRQGFYRSVAILLGGALLIIALDVVNRV